MLELALEREHACDSLSRKQSMTKPSGSWAWMIAAQWSLGEPKLSSRVPISPLWQWEARQLPPLRPWQSWKTGASMWE